METRRLPIGISDYKKMIDEGYYYVDKTDFIRQIIEEGALITLLPRPRRFGKTLNLSMLRYFFEKTDGNVFRPLFDGKRIREWKDFDKHQGQYPVIMLTLKDCKADTFDKALELVASELQKEFFRHKYLLDSPVMDSTYRPIFQSLLEGNPGEVRMQRSLLLLSELLTAHWGMPPLVLLDEYDTPIHVAFDKGYYDRMIVFMRNFMSMVFKDNTSVFRGVITGILRVSKESIFSGLNNIAVFSLLDRPMSTAFGFIQDEVDGLLDDYSQGRHKEEIKRWYNGYLFGGHVIYNPWSVLNYIMYDGVFAPYWVNTGSDVLLRHLIAEGPSQVRKGIETLVQGGSLCSVINDKLAFPDLLSSASNIWSFMLFSGYLKASEGTMTPDHLMSYTLGVPNTEVSTVFSTIIRGWINDGPVKNDRLEMMLQALDENDIEAFEEILNEFVVNTLSYYDTNGRDPEKVYQAFLLGMLVSHGSYKVSSNRESGLGRYDILMCPVDVSRRGYIMELKRLRMSSTVETTLDTALQQIKDKRYAATLHAAGVRDILEMAITFDGKRVWVKTSE
ncbi:AAA family ATPase [Parabacteroides distasonis]|uniref:AAA family ATPase n=1 Tax=Parabacteroides distasonis TaxID=823 RepID=UPI001C3D9160|nr:AAA family ATPase [Parabacteroides distasonis]MCR1851199.1 ATP-binding protein [Parabacteroides distasonis]